VPHAEAADRAAAGVAQATLGWPPFADVHAVVAAHMKLSAVLFGVALPDYALTMLVAVLERRPRLLLLGFFFPLLPIVDAAIGLSAIPAGWFVRSNGTWQSPARREFDAAPLRIALPADAADQVMRVSGAGHPDYLESREVPESRPVPVSPVIAATERFERERTHANR
jgi:hypothetical protein